MLHHLPDGELRLAHGRLEDRGPGNLVFEFHGRSITPKKQAGNALNRRIQRSCARIRGILYFGCTVYVRKNTARIAAAGTAICIG
jgi:hypothetical protein